MQGKTSGGRLPSAAAASPATAARVSAAVWLLVVLALWHPRPAFAGWPLDSAASVTCGFGQKYSAADGSPSTHAGADLASSPGAGVCAPFAGTVNFVGRVPAPGGGGATVLAVTVTTAEGNVTLLPLESACVTKGQQVAENEEVGSLASEGDPSSSAPHLHVGLRKGDLYIDPMSVMRVAPAREGGDANASAVTSAETAGAAAGAAAAAGACSVAADSALAAAGAATTPAETAAGEMATGGTAMRLPTAGEELAPGVSIPGGEARAATGAGFSATPSSALDTGAQEASAAEIVQGCVDRALRQVSSLAKKGVRGAAVGLIGVLFGAGCLFPLWRAGRKGLSEVSVDTKVDDVAAVAGQ